MAGQNIINELGTLLKVSNRVLEEVASKECLCIGSLIHDSLLAGDETLAINVGIGTLSIDLINMQSKFVPSKELRTVIKKSLSERIDPLACELEKTLAAKLTKVCEEVL